MKRCIRIIIFLQVLLFLLLYHVGKIYAADNYQGSMVNSLFYAYNWRDWANYVHNFGRNGNEVTGKWTYDCGFVFEPGSNPEHDWHAPNGLNGYQTNSVKLTTKHSGLWYGFSYEGGSETYFSFRYTITVNHVYGSWKRSTNPTCTANGSEYRTCSGCGTRQTRSVAALGHSWTGWESDGSSHWKRCKRCNTKTSQSAHNWGGYYSDTANCTAGGTKKHKCGTCGKEVSVSSSALGHVWPSTYTQDGGYLYKYCTRCKNQLEKKPISYSIKFNGNGATSGSMSGQGLAYGTAQNLFKNAFVRQNYEFLGWALDSESAEVVYSDQQSVNNLTTTNNTTINLYAVWKLSTTTITFHDQGGTGGPGEVIWLIGSIQSPTAPKREGYNFAGWNTSENGAGDSWPVNNVVVAGHKDYYAQWIPNMYTTVEEK